MTRESLTVGSQFSWNLWYFYDANGHLNMRFTPSGQYYITQPNALGQPTMLGIQNVNTYISNITHLPDGHIASFHWTNGVTHQVSENVRGLPSQIHDSAAGNNVEDLAYTYDANGNPVHITDYADGARSTSMTYDGLNRLSSATIAGVDGGLQASYSYDALNRITQVAQGTRLRTYSYDSYYHGRLSSIADSQAGTSTFAYDAQGNLSQRNGVAYTFDIGNRLRDVAGEEGGYAYDAWGRRVAQTDTTGTIYSFYDHTGQLVYQRDRTGGTHDYLYLGGKLVAIRDYDTQGIARVMRYQDSNALGSIIRQTDKNGADFPDTAVVYDAWGGMHGATPRDGPGYTGHVQDADTNLVYMQQRYYDPEVGRFLSMDPVQASGTTGANLDRYWYAKDNPYRYTDPNGEHSAGEAATPCRPGPYCGHAGAQGLLTFSGNVVDLDNGSGLEGGASGLASGGSAGGATGAAASASTSHSQSTQAHVDPSPTQPRRFVIKGDEDRGSYDYYSYQLLDAQGKPITGSGYSAAEHIVPASLVTNSNNVFGGLDNGVFHDIVGWKHPIKPDSGSGIVITFQTFSVTNENGRNYNLSTEFVHVNAYYALPSPLDGIYINYVLPVKP